MQKVKMYTQTNLLCHTKRSEIYVKKQPSYRKWCGPQKHCCEIKGGDQEMATNMLRFTSFSPIFYSLVVFTWIIIQYSSTVYRDHKGVRFLVP